MASSLANSLDQAERDLILDALRSGQGNRREAAERLGISQRTLRYKLAGCAKPASTSRPPEELEMSQMEIDSVLAQIRSLSTRHAWHSQATAPQKSGPSEFANLLSKGIDQ